MCLFVHHLHTSISFLRSEIHFNKRKDLWYLLALFTFLLWHNTPLTYSVHYWNHGIKDPCIYCSQRCASVKKWGKKNAIHIYLNNPLCPTHYYTGLPCGVVPEWCLCSELVHELHPKESHCRNNKNKIIVTSYVTCWGLQISFL